jgi:EAL domain-containing protein (putative c-di-GMP-specific phosphodiesterase class I)
MKLIAAGAEAKLVEELATLKSDTQDLVGVHFHFDQLLEHYRSDYQIKIATNLVTDLLKHQEGGIYLFRDCSLVVLGREIPRALLDKAIFQLRYLFMDDPLAYTADGHENPKFCRLYQLETDYEMMADMARRQMLGGRQSSTGAGAASAKGGAAKAKTEGSPATRFFNASNLERIEKSIHEVDIFPAMRRQPVCATIPNMSVRRVFDELYLNITHLRDLLGTDIDLLSNRWLFKYLTLAMDDRVLALLKERSGVFLGSPISLNLNVRTLMSDKFAAFDAFLKPSTKVSVVLEIQASDVFEDMVAFFSARDSVQRLGYRICLDGLNHQSFPMIDREHLGVDLVKLQWNANIKGDSFNAENQAVAQAVKRCGANRIILTRCDNRQAVDYGQALGISLFQGRYLDELIDPMSNTVN